MAPLQGALPDRYGDWGLECLTTQDKTRREVAGTIVRARPKPPVFRPPEDFGGWSPQSGLGTKENRFEHRVHSKIPEEMNAPIFKPTTGQTVRGSFQKTFEKYPKYLEDPWEAKIAAAKARAQSERSKITARWKPSTGDQDYRLCRTATPAFAYLGSSSITFRPSNFGR